MDIKQLNQLIKNNYNSRRDFIKSFNDSGGELEETVLSAQLNGRRKLSCGWRSAYSLFFKQSLKFDDDYIDASIERSEKYIKMAEKRLQKETEKTTT